VADLSITKTADMDMVTVGDTITKKLEVTNNGPADATGVTVTDNLPANVNFLSASAECTATGPDRGTVTCELGNLGVNAIETVEIAVEADMAGTVENTATVDGDDDDDYTADNTDSDTVVVEQGTADLRVTKTANPDSVTVGDTITFTIDVENTGPDRAAGVTVTDTLPTQVTFSSATAEDGGTCTRTGPEDGRGGTVTCDLGFVSVNDTETVTIVVTANMAGEVPNTASAATQSDDRNPDNDSSTDTVTVNSS